MKKLCMTRLLGGRTLEQLLPIRQEETFRLIKTLFEKSEKKDTVNIGAELGKLTNNVISRMAMNRRCSGSDAEAEEARKLVEETTELTGKFNLADYIGFCKNLDLQGFDKRLKDLHQRFDKMMEGILKEKDEERRKRMDMAEEEVKDLLDILLDIADDVDAEIKLTRENIKAFILVRSVTIYYKFIIILPKHLAKIFCNMYISQNLCHILCWPHIRSLKKNKKGFLHARSIIENL